MRNQMIRVLHVLGGLNRGGAETMLMNIYRAIDRKVVQFDFIIHDETENEYINEIELLGGRVFVFPKFKGYNVIQYRKKWNHFLKLHSEYKVLHSHVRSYSCFYLPIAKKYGLKTISHSHSISNGDGLKSKIKNILQIPLSYQSDYMFACSLEAGKWLFGSDAVNNDNFFIIPNAIKINEFTYDKVKRDSVRKLLNLEDKIIIGHVGRYCYEKNFPFLVELVENLKNINEKYVLIQLGNGKESKKLQEVLKERSLEENFITLGVRDDVPKLMQAMDLFVFPSHNEGLGMVAIEAQTSGLPCILSDTIPKEVKLTNLVKFLPINNDDSLNIWTNEVLELSNFIRTDTSDRIKKSGYDINDTSDFLLKFYKELYV